MKRRHEEGAVLVTAVLMLPVMLLALALVADAGWLLLARQLASNAADMAALAAVQELDEELLRQGQLALDGSRARAMAIEYARHNLQAALPGLDLQSEVAVSVEVHQPSPSVSPRCRVTGRELEHPTVCVSLELTLPLRLLPVPGGRVRVKAHADASVVLP